MSETTLPDQPRKEAAQQPTAVSQSDLRLLQKNLGRLAQFMASPDLLYQAIRAKYGNEGMLPEQLQTLLELLPKSGPLLEVSGESGKWLVDIHSTAPPIPQSVAPPQSESQTLSGTAEEQKKEAAPEDAITSTDSIEGVPANYFPKPLTLVVPAEQRAVSEAASAVAAPAAGVPTQNDVLLNTIQNILEVDQEIRRMTEERLNLERIASELRIIGISPPFEAFRSNAQTVSDALRHNPPVAPDPARVSIVSQYQDVLDRGSGALLKTLLLAALLASSDGKASNARSLTSTIRFLSTELEFASLSTEQINKVLDELAGGVSQTGGDGPGWLEQFRQLTGAYLQPQVLPVAVLMGQELASRLASLEDPALVRYVYRNRTRSLILHLRSGNRLPLMDLLELRLLHAEKLTRFSGDPNALPLGDYACALNNAFANEAEAFIMAVFLKLGFVGYVQSALAKPDVKGAIDPDLWQDLAEQAGLSKGRSGRMSDVLIVTGKRLLWPPSTQQAVVQLEPDLLKKLETPRVSLCLVGGDVDAAAILIRKWAPAARLATLDEDAGSVDEAIRRALATTPAKTRPPSESGPETPPA